MELDSHENFRFFNIFQCTYIYLSFTVHALNFVKDKFEKFSSFDVYDRCVSKDPMCSWATTETKPRRTRLWIKTGGSTPETSDSGWR